MSRADGMDKINYQVRLDKIIESLNGSRPRLLLHSCCGPCSSYVIEYLSKYFDLTVYYYNPNIYPIEEYEKRLETQKQLLERLGGAAMIDSEYDPDRYFEQVSGLENEREGGKRCTVCFEMRLRRTAEKAKIGKFDYFATTLTVSPHKNTQIINQIGEELADEYSVKWLPSDFKKREGYKRSIELSKQFELYRQNYCGCKFSLM